MYIEEKDAVETQSASRLIKPFSGNHDHTPSYLSYGNFANKSLKRSIGAAIKPATVSKGGLSGASGWLLYNSQPVLTCQR